MQWNNNNNDNSTQKSVAELNHKREKTRKKKR